MDVRLTSLLAVVAALAAGCATSPQPAIDIATAETPAGSPDPITRSGTITMYAAARDPLQVQWVYDGDANFIVPRGEHDVVFTVEWESPIPARVFARIEAPEAGFQIDQTGASPLTILFPANLTHDTTHFIDLWPPDEVGLHVFHQYRWVATIAPAHP